MRSGTTEFDVLRFWRMPWSKGLRDACEWLQRELPPIWGCPEINARSPWWVRPFFLQHWATEAIVARKAWLAAHPTLPLARSWRFPNDSKPDWRPWEEVTWTFAEPWCLRAMSEGGLLECLLCDVERLQRILLDAPRMVGPGEWGQAIMMACGHLAQYYHELKRRYGVQRAREIVQEQLQAFVTWQPEAAQAAAPPSGQSGGL